MHPTYVQQQNASHAVLTGKKTPKAAYRVISGNSNHDARPTAAAVSCAQWGSAADARNVRRIYYHGEKTRLEASSKCSHTKWTPSTIQ